MAEHYLGFVRFADREHFPDVDVTAEKGSGLPTQVGVVLPDLTPGQVVDQATAQYFIQIRGDDNQEYITNDAVRVWRQMRCHRFRFTTTLASPTSAWSATRRDRPTARRPRPVAQELRREQGPTRRAADTVTVA